MVGNMMERCTEWRGEHAAVTVNTVNYIDLLARYEDTGLTPAQISAIVVALEEKKKNEPLTLEELYNMDGLPVFISLVTVLREYTLWGIVSTENSNPHERGGGCMTDKGFVSMDRYGISWTAYRHPPVGIEE